jgi:hypothetical protein
VDCLKNSVHFLAICETFTLERLAEVFIKEMVARHDVPVSIVFDRDTWFTSRFWKKFREAMGTRLNIRMAYHLQTEEHFERTIQTLKDMLRACIVDFGGSWDNYLPLTEFSYSNSYDVSTRMPPYEALYIRRCRTLICWGEVGQKELGRKDVIEATTEKYEIIKACMKAAQDSQRSYANKRRRLMYSIE